MSSLIKTYSLICKRVKVACVVDIKLLLYGLILLYSPVANNRGGLNKRGGDPADNLNINKRGGGVQVKGGIWKLFHVAWDIANVTFEWFKHSNDLNIRMNKNPTLARLFYFSDA